MPEHPDITWSVAKPHSNSEPWAEAILEFHRNGQHRSSIDLTREGGERLIEAMHAYLHPWAGMSIREQIWGHLDAATDRLLNGGDADDDRGFARGLAMAIAIFTNPYNPNIAAVRAEAMERQGHERSVLATTDPQTLWLVGAGVVELQAIAAAVKIKGYQKLSKAALVKALDEYDLDAWRLPAPAAVAAPAGPAEIDEEIWDLTAD